MRRRDNGAPIREAMAAAGLSVRGLAAATKQLDPTGKGVSASWIGKVRAEAGAESGRDTLSADAAALIAAALHESVDSLFADDDLFVPGVSTISPKLQTEKQIRAAGIECMVDAATLSVVIKKSTNWIYAQPAAHPAGSPTPFPVHYAGASPRYLISEVLVWMAAVRERELAAA